MKRLVSTWVAFLLVAISSVCANKVVLQINITNPRELEQAAQIYSCLPGEIRPDDVLDAHGLNVIYDIKEKTYAIQGQIELEALEKRTFNIVLKDIWQISDKSLADLNSHAEILARKLKKDTDDIHSLISRIRKRQNKNRTSNVGPNKHIAAYRKNLLLLDQVKTALSKYENELIKDGKDPGQITFGTMLSTPAKNTPPKSSVSKASVIRIKVTNTSPLSSRKIPIRRELPEEILPNDIIDADGLEVRIDQAKGVCYLYKEFVELEPNTSTAFNVRLKDKWDIQDQKIEELKAEAGELLTSIQFWRRYPSLENELKGIQVRLDTIGKTEKPTRFSAAYIAFFRDQAASLNQEILAITRIKSISFPSGSLGTPEPPPNTNTTWMIIYIILVLLGIASIIALSGCRFRDPRQQEVFS